MNTVRDRATEPRLLSSAAVVGSCVMFVVIGAFQALYGPAIPTFREKFGISPSVAGMGLSAHFIGALLGVLLFHLSHRAIGNRMLLGCACSLMALGGVGFATAPSWPLALLAAWIIGLGFGGIDYGLNQLFSVGFGRHSAAMLNLLNAHFGVGAVAGPALVAWLGPQRYPWIFVGCGLASLTLLPVLNGVRRDEPEQVRQTNPAVRSALTIVTAFVVIYVLHVAIETGVGGWEPTHLEALGFGAGAAATATSLYWLTITAGRFLVIPVSLRLSASTIVTASCTGMVACLALASIPVLTPVAYAGVGLFIAPIFPTGLPWLNRAVPTIRNAGAYVIAASMIGGVAFPPLLGKAIEVSGVGVIPLLLLGFALSCLALSLWLTVWSHRNLR